jgi:hypothetical protein
MPSEGDSIDPDVAQAPRANMAADTHKDLNRDFLDVSLITFFPFLIICHLGLQEMKNDKEV